MVVQELDVQQLEVQEAKVQELEVQELELLELEVQNVKVWKLEVKKKAAGLTPEWLVAEVQVCKFGRSPMLPFSIRTLENQFQKEWGVPSSRALSFI